MFQLRFTTLVEAPLTVAYDVARQLGGPWSPASSDEQGSRRPWRDSFSAPGPGRRRLAHTREFSATPTGTLVEERVTGTTGVPGALGQWIDRKLLGPRVRRAMRPHLDAYAAAAAEAASRVTQVVGAALVDDRARVLVAQRGAGPLAGLWEFPGGKVEAGEGEQEALVRECREELGVEVRPAGFLGEVPLDGVVAGGVPGTSTLRVWWGRVVAGELVAHEHRELRWSAENELEALDWIPADRPLLPAVRALLAGGS